VYVWIDEAEIQVGDSLIEKIRQGIDVVDYLVVVLSPDSVKSEWVKKEVDIAMNQEINNRRVKVLPVMNRRCELPWFLEGKLYADFTNPENYSTSLGMLLLDKLDVKDNTFRKQSSIFQTIESMLYPLIKEADAALLLKIPETEIVWEYDGEYQRARPDKNLADVLEKLKNRYLGIIIQVLDLLALTPEHLSAFKEIEEIYNVIIIERRKKVNVISLLETEANPRYRERWWDRMQEYTKNLSTLHEKYSELTRNLKKELGGERLWSIETLLEFESKLDATYLRANRIYEYDKTIGW